MDFVALNAQREKNSKPAEAVVKSTAGRPIDPKSKKSMGWVSGSFYLKPETRLRLQNVVMRAKLAGLDGPLDQSEAIEAALSVYLDQIEAECDGGKKSPRTRKKG